MNRPNGYNARVFSPLTLRVAILEPLRYLFSRVPSEDLRYDVDPEKTKIVIDSQNNMNQDTVTQQKPRILLNSGGYTMSRPGLTDNLVDQKNFVETGGRRETINMLLVNGMCTLTVEAPEEGVAMLISDMASNFLTWSEPYVCQTFGFKSLGIPLRVGDCEQATENVEKYRIPISIPWSIETIWQVRQDALKLKEFIMSLDNP